VKPSFFFYDLETSGLNPKEDRVMQFAGQRTDLDLNKIGKPFNYLIKITEDILPDPQAILITGITPQQTVKKGLSEAAFLAVFHQQITTPGTIFIGYNNISFDDEFMRYMNYRNFYDPYEWQWQDQRGRWDLLSVVRMTRALRPEGIKWPKDFMGNSVNTLEELAAVNHLDHIKAHDARSDVNACIDLARLVQKTQPKLFTYLFNIRDKRDVAKLVTRNKPFVFVGSYQNEFEKTSVYSYLFELINNQEAMLFDLRYDPLDFINLSAEELIELWQDKQSDHDPLKTIKYNRCPAIAPLNVLNETSWMRLKLEPAQLNKHLKLLKENLTQWLPTVRQAVKLYDKTKRKHYRNITSGVDSQLYEKFFDEVDKKALIETRETPPSELSIAKFQYSDQRLRRLLPLYKARNYPESLTETEKRRWHDYCQRHLLQGGDKSRYAQFVIRFQSLVEDNNLRSKNQKILSELESWAHQLIPNSDR
jgi:exodeoxyribonuclease-1